MALATLMLRYLHALAALEAKCSSIQSSRGRDEVLGVQYIHYTHLHILLWILSRPLLHSILFSHVPLYARSCEVAIGICHFQYEPNDQNNVSLWACNIVLIDSSFSMSKFLVLQLCWSFHKSFCCTQGTKILVMQHKKKLKFKFYLLPCRL